MVRVQGKHGGVADVPRARLGEPSLYAVFRHFDFVL